MLAEWANVISLSILNLLWEKRVFYLVHSYSVQTSLMFWQDSRTVLNMYPLQYLPRQARGTGLCYTAGLCLFCFDIQLSVLGKVAKSCNYDHLGAESGGLWVDTSLGYIMRSISKRNVKKKKRKKQWQKAGARGKRGRAERGWWYWDCEPRMCNALASFPNTAPKTSTPSLHCEKGHFSL